jgi:ABC-type uncharacterized transport system ATPase component
LMVTHSMHRAVHLGDRLVMMHRGEILHDSAARPSAVCAGRT